MFFVCSDQLHDPAAISPLRGPRRDDPRGVAGCDDPRRARGRLRAINSVDEVEQIRNQVVAVKAYAEQAKDVELETLAAEIKLRAERPSCG